MLSQLQSPFFLDCYWIRIQAEDSHSASTENLLFSLADVITTILNMFYGVFIGQSVSSFAPQPYAMIRHCPDDFVSTNANLRCSLYSNPGRRPRQVVGSTK